MKEEKINTCSNGSASRTRVLAAAPILLIAAAWQPSYAQTIDEIVVSARKKDESLQDVPISITVQSRAAILERGIRSNYDIANFTPNFNTVQQVGRNLDRPVIRGMANPPSRGEPNASYFIDGVFISGSISTATLENIERVEILRGPQSAQFGRATFAGAVNYITRQPTDDFELELSTRAGTNDDYKIGGRVSGPIIENMLRFAVSANWEKYGGQWHNELQPGAANPEFYWETPIDQGDSTRLGEEETTDVDVKINFTPTDSSELRLVYAYTEGEDGHFPSFLQRELNCLLPNDPLDANFATTPGAFCGTHRIDGLRNTVNIPDFNGGVLTGTRSPENPDGAIVQSAEPGAFRQTHRVTAAFLQDLGDWSFELNGSYSESEFENVFDLDHSDHRALFGLFNFLTLTEDRNYSVEFRVRSPEQYPIRTQLGMYYYDFRRSAQNRMFPGIGAIFDPFGRVGLSSATISTTENLAVFGDLSVDILENLTLDAELRWASDEKTTKSPDGLGAALDFDSVTPRFSLRYRPTDELSLYVTAAKGTKPGGFNNEYFEGDKDPTAVQQAIADGSAFIDEEEAWNYEIGAKTTWLDQRLSTTLAAFYIDWTNQGIAALVDIPLATGGAVAPTAVIRNAGMTEIYGIEFENILYVSEYLQLNASYGYTDAEFVEFNDPDFANLTGLDDPDLVNGGNVSGHRVPNTPAHQVILGGRFGMPVRDSIGAFLRADFVYESDRAALVDNFGRIDSRELLNLRLGLEHEAWSLSLYGKNILDNDTPTAVLSFFDFDAANELSNGEAPRTYGLNPQRGRDWGIEFQYRFQKL